jgi:hypothetical protein
MQTRTQILKNCMDFVLENVQIQTNLKIKEPTTFLSVDTISQYMNTVNQNIVTDLSTFVLKC